MHISARNPNRKNAHLGGSGLLISTEYSYALETGQPHFVLDILRSIGTQSKSTKNILTTKIMGTSRKLTSEDYQSLTYFVGDSPASLFPSQVNEEDLKIREELYSSILRELPNTKDLVCFSLKTLKVFFPTTREELSIPSSPRLMSWGMTYNGKCLTARISESPRIGKECSLSVAGKELDDLMFFR